ncbi:MAG: hypothetical protein ABGW95_04820 [Candidatus Poseidoniia archaeon]
MSLRVRSRATAGEHVELLVHDQPRDADWVGDIVDSGDRPQPAVTARHRRVDLHRAVGAQAGAGAGVEARVVLERNDRGDRSTDRVSAACEQLPANIGSGVNTILLFRRMAGAANVA